LREGLRTHERPNDSSASVPARSGREGLALLAANPLRGIFRVGGGPKTTSCVGLLVALVAALLAQTATADSLRCNGRLLKVGDPTARLLAECGEPLSRGVVAVVRDFDDGEQVRSSYVETWSYPTASTRGYQLVRFESGRLVGEGMRCRAGLVREGDAKVTVLQKCGEPTTRDSAGLVDEQPGPAERSTRSESLVEQWVYSQQKGSLLRIVEVRGGRIESITNGPRQ
jgi:hypothetical protein